MNSAHSINETEITLAIEKRGFFVTKNIGWTELIKTIFHGCGFFGLSLLFFPILITFFVVFGGTSVYLKNENIITISYLLIVTGIIIHQFLFKYLKSGFTFFTENGTIDYGSIKISGIYEKKFYGSIIYQIMDRYYILSIIGFFIFSMVLPILLEYNNVLTYGESGNIVIIFLIILFFLSSFGIYIGRMIYQTIFPVFAFGTIGYNVQTMTPIIASESEKMKENLGAYMNFRDLRRGFDTLSSNVEKVINLIIRLEKAEKRLKQGNLFNSRKYIDSLIQDIVHPLKKFRDFLNEQVMFLRLSNKATLQSPIGDNSLLRLTSARSDLLVLELTKNITKLDKIIQQLS